jgi:glycosyltransferase involved in cell wall biosynthesis
VKKIVIVSGFRVFPARTGAQVRTSGFVRALARIGYEVLVYSLAGRRADYQAGGPGFRRDEIETRLIEETNLGAFFGLTQMVARRLDLPRYWHYSVLSRGLVPKRLKIALAQADVIVSDFSFCPPIPGPWSAKPWYLLSHQLEHKLLALGSPRQVAFAERMRRVESAVPARYRDIFACAEADRDFYKARDASARLKVPIIPCAVDPAMYVAEPGTRERVRAELGLTDEDRLLVFSGSNFHPNEEAAQQLKAFARGNAAELARLRIHFLLLGSMEPTPFRDGAVIATGRVPEVLPYFAAADAGLNPVVRGTGANVKLFEYLAAQLPVISTLFGVRGSELEAERDFLPYTPENPLASIARFATQREPAQWRAFAAEVWQRHRGSCDVNLQVQAALHQALDFPAP